jgi:hypothetical protein
MADMMRRDLFAVAPAAVAAGMLLRGVGGTPPAPAGYREPTQPGVAAGPSSGIIRARQVIISGPNGSVLVYSGTPAAGNLIASMAGTAFHDPAGNAVLSQVTSYQVIAGTAYAVQMAGSAITFWTAATQAGPYTNVANVGIDASANLLLQSAAGIIRSTSPYEAISGLQPGTTGTKDTYRDITAQLQNLWTVGGGAYFEEKLYADNTVGVRSSQLVPGTFADGTAIWNIPTGYVPAKSNQNFPINVNYTAAPAYGSTPFIAVRSNGTATIQNLRGTPANISFNFRYPLD